MFFSRMISKLLPLVYMHKTVMKLTAHLAEMDYVILDTDKYVAILEPWKLATLSYWCFPWLAYDISRSQSHFSLELSFGIVVVSKRKISAPSTVVCLIYIHKSSVKWSPAIHQQSPFKQNILRGSNWYRCLHSMPSSMNDHKANIGIFHRSLRSEERRRQKLCWLYI